ncbi:Spindle Spc25 domain containing protein [Trichuris trichiura]|uniref:Kinetochore protein SPC25 n=1 Tax=Trichuris trichiura TaxID=36087 RepID=A0A077YZX9_TRITR|nr:Spindle Spc25 domain containing protein [Trichuris trichiura]
MSDLVCGNELAPDAELRTVLTSGNEIASRVEVFQGIIAHLQDWQTSILNKAADEVKRLKEECTVETLDLINAVAEVDSDERNTEVSFELLSTTRNKIEAYEKLKNTTALVEVALCKAEETVKLVGRIRNYYAKELGCLVAMLGLHVAIGPVDSAGGCITLTFTRLNSDIPNVACKLIIQKTSDCYKLLNMQPYVEPIVQLVDDLNRTRKWTTFLTRVRGQFQRFLTH